jgi:GNAT superfamily N-acetyltransferase
VIEPARTTLPDGADITIRRLAAPDAKEFGRFLSGLSEETRRFYRPHALDEAEARRICASVDTDPALRLIATADDGNEIEAYVLTQFEIPADEKQRYADYGITLQDEVDCRIAPGVADSWQDRGLGSVMLHRTLESLRLLGLRHVVLFGGTQAVNSRAIHVYQKLGFQTLGTFVDAKGIENIDMWIPEVGGTSPRG